LAIEHEAVAVRSRLPGDLLATQAQPEASGLHLSRYFVPGEAEARSEVRAPHPLQAGVRDEDLGPADGSRLGGLGRQPAFHPSCLTPAPLGSRALRTREEAAQRDPLPFHLEV